MKKTRPDQKEAAEAAQKAAEMVAETAQANLKVAKMETQRAAQDKRIAGYALEQSNKKRARRAHGASGEQ